MKKYVIIAGVNGAGKSTFYQSDVTLLNLPRINVDEIVRGIGSWQNPADVLEGGKQAVLYVWPYVISSGTIFSSQVGKKSPISAEQN